MKEIVSLWIPGHARSKGSMRCQGGRPGQHRLVEQVRLSKPWREEMQREIVKHVRGKQLNPAVKHEPYSGALRVSCKFAFEQPARGDGAKLPYPTLAAGINAIGDLDKLVRNVLDALQGSGLIKNDCNVTTIIASKRWGASEGLKLGVWEEIEEMERGMETWVGTRIN